MDTGGMKVHKAVIVTKSTNFEPRAEIVGEYLKGRGIEVTYIYADFSHREKRKLNRSVPDHIYIDTFPYRRNLSWQRMWSQVDFAKKVEKKLKGLDFDLLYVLIPGNSLVPMAVRAAEEKAEQRERKVKAIICADSGAKDVTDTDASKPRVVFDIIDLWPESLRLGKLEKIWPFTYWKRLRDKDISKADLIVAECDLYRERLELDPRKSVTMYWGKKETDIIPSSIPTTDGKALEIAYLGAINNIIDIDGIVRLLRILNQRLEPDGRSVLLHVIGDGENRDMFLQSLSSVGIEYQYHGAVFDEMEKDKILSRCSYGLNMMKPGVCVGMTMKSIDYWSHGLPIINNIPGDTERFCREQGLGINVDMSRHDKSWEEPADHTGKPDPIDDILTGRFTEKDNKDHILDIYKTSFTELAMHKVLDKYFPQ